MKTLKTIISNSAIGSLSQAYKCAVICLFSGIMVTLFTLFIFIVNNSDHVSTRFNF